MNMLKCMTITWCYVEDQVCFFVFLSLSGLNLLHLSCSLLVSISFVHVARCSLAYYQIGNVKSQLWLYFMRSNFHSTENEEKHKCGKSIPGVLCVLCVLCICRSCNSRSDAPILTQMVRIHCHVKLHLDWVYVSKCISSQALHALDHTTTRFAPIQISPSLESKQQYTCTSLFSCSKWQIIRGYKKVVLGCK